MIVNLYRRMEVQMNKTVNLTTKDFAAKFKTKNEIYQFLAVDVKAYMPPRDVVTIYFLKDLVFKKKNRK